MKFANILTAHKSPAEAYHDDISEAHADGLCDPDCPRPHCSECGSGNVEVAEYDFGYDRETGYQDMGERVKCLDCGVTGEDG